MAYKRWYDVDRKLSSIVADMEFMTQEVQVRFGEKMLELSEILLEERGGEAYMERLNETKKAALGKSNVKRRWYDQHDSLHQAFNNLYALTDADRRDIAMRLFTPIEIVKGYEKQCVHNEKAPDLRVIDEVLRTSLLDGEARARKLYSLYLMDYGDLLREAQNADSPAGLKKKNDDSGFWTNLLSSLQKALSAA